MTKDQVNEFLTIREVLEMITGMAEALKDRCKHCTTWDKECCVTCKTTKALTTNDGGRIEREE